MAAFVDIFSKKGAAFDAELDTLFGSSAGQVDKKRKRPAEQDDNANEQEEDEKDDSSSASEDEDDEEDGDSEEASGDDEKSEAEAPTVPARSSTAAATEKAERQLQRQQEEEKTKRTVFVSNLSVTAAGKALTKKLKQLFQQYGAVESIRFRSMAFNSALPRRLNFKMQNFHSDRDTLNAYVVYKQVESVEKALALNGSVFEDKHLRVDRARSKGGDRQQSGQDNKRSVFVGNLAFDIKDEDLWRMFEEVGDVEYVRVVRDRHMGIGKGFGYVQFKDRATVPLALKLHETDFQGKPIRVLKCKDSAKLSSDAKAKSSTAGEGKPQGKGTSAASKDGDAPSMPKFKDRHRNRVSAAAAAAPTAAKSYAGDVAVAAKKPRLQQRTRGATWTRANPAKANAKKTTKQKARSTIKKLKKAEKKQGSAGKGQQAK
ncbi:Nucleolar protein 12 [Sorochytrium milnesiophthora]